MNLINLLIPFLLCLVIVVLTIDNASLRAFKKKVQSADYIRSQKDLQELYDAQKKSVEHLSRIGLDCVRGQ